ncbi:MAG: glycosyltransferase [Chloroflexi bacterium]|nr:glycosyltransferase [Chloroflexota bacterium]
MNANNLAGTKIVIASYMHVMKGEFTTLGGPALALRNYCATRAARLLCIWQPLPISDTLDALAEVFQDGSRKTHRLWSINWPFDREGGINLLYVALKARDLLADLYFGIRLRDRYDLWIGVEALNAIMGVVMRRAGIVRRVIYYNLDYGETRFKNALLNRVFHGLDRLAARHADMVWNLSDEMERTRSRLVGGRVRFAPQTTVPIGTDVDRITRLPLEQIGRYSVVYLGLLSDNTGAMLALDSMPAIVRALPHARLLIVGSGPLEGLMRARARTMGLEDKVEFRGRVSDREVEETLRVCAVGLAPYAPDPDSIKRFTDVTKPRMYMTCGVPVVITDVPPIAKEISAGGAGIIAPYDQVEFANAVVRILSDDDGLKEFRQNAVALASKYSWVDIFSRAFSETRAALGDVLREAAPSPVKGPV